MAVAPIRSGFWLQQANREGDELLAFADELAWGRSGRPGFAFGPVNAPGTLNPLFERARNSGDAILDPQGHAIDRDPTSRAKKHYPWLVLSPRPSTQQEWEAWMQEAMDHELSPALRGTAPMPSFAVTASPFIEAASGQAELYAVLDAAVAVAARQTAGPETWIGLTVDRTYLRDDLHLTRLANAMLATAADGFVFRAPHTQMPPVDDRRYLAGLREIIQACSANGVRIFLPNSGWLGWLAMAWGAWGYSAGMGAGTWNDKVPGPMNAPERPSEPIFEHQLMRTVKWTVHQQLIHETAYLPCGCPECVQMAGTHDLALAKRHQIRHAHDEGFLLTSTPAPQRAASVAVRLDAAIAFRDSLSAMGQARAGAEFLDRWRALV